MNNLILYKTIKSMNVKQNINTELNSEGVVSEDWIHQVASGCVNETLVTEVKKVKPECLRLDQR